MKIGLALSGGGARGIAHIVVIKALEEMGLRFSCISGTSAGSMVAALYAYGYSPDEMLDIIQQVKLFKSVKMAWAWSGLLTMGGIEDMLVKFMPENDFGKLKIPLTIAATEICRGETHYFTEGELAKAIMASCSIPAVFSPMSYRDGVYVDGGILDNLPVRPIRKQCDFIVGSHCNQIPPEFDPRNMKVVIERTMLMAINCNTQISKGMCDVVIEPPGLGKYGSFDMTKSMEIFDFAYRHTKENFKWEMFDKKATV
jgi:NTE family protein